MIISATELKGLYTEFNDVGNTKLERKLSAIESAIRAFTHNNFQVRSIRSLCEAQNNTLVFIEGNWQFKVGDTIQLSDDLNDGLYVVTQVSGNTITIGSSLYSTKTLITKVQYPLDVVEGAINVLRWDLFEDKHDGVASESISRHSVSYVNYDQSNTISGYPVRLFGFCNPYMRART